MERITRFEDRDVIKKLGNPKFIEEVVAVQKT